MKLLLLMTIALILPITSWAQDNTRSPAPIVFFDIAGPDMNVLRTFYNTVFNWGIGGDGGFATSVPSLSLMGTLRQEALPETLVYIGVADITATLAEVVTNGGTVEFPRMVVPGVVILGMFRDPAGNRVGLVEMENGTAKIQ